MPIPTARSLVQEILLKISDGAEYDLGDIKRHVIQVFSIPETSLASPGKVRLL